MLGSLDTCCYRRGVSEPVGAVTPAGSCCFRLDELPRIVLRLGKCVKCYLTPLAIGAVFLLSFYLTPLAIAVLLIFFFRTFAHSALPAAAWYFCLYCGSFFCPCGGKK